MEEHRDLDLTVTRFARCSTRTSSCRLGRGSCSRPTCPSPTGSSGALAWRSSDVAGRRALKLRIVKGANLAMERIEAARARLAAGALHRRKTEVDANFKRMVEYGCRPITRAVHLGIATHNLFDVAHGLVLRGEKVSSLRRVRDAGGHGQPPGARGEGAGGGLLLYAPVVRAEDFHSASPTSCAASTRTRRRTTSSATSSDSSRGRRTGRASDRFEVRPRGHGPGGTGRSRGRRNRGPRSTGRGRSTKWPTPHPGFLERPDTDWSVPGDHEWIGTVVARWRDRFRNGCRCRSEVACRGRRRGRRTRSLATGARRLFLRPRRCEQVSHALEAAPDARPAWAGRPPSGAPGPAGSGALSAWPAGAAISSGP